MNSFSNFVIITAMLHQLSFIFNSRNKVRIMRVLSKSSDMNSKEKKEKYYKIHKFTQTLLLSLMLDKQRRSGQGQLDNQLCSHSHEHKGGWVKC